jgi:hypothetical protein
MDPRPGQPATRLVTAPVALLSVIGAALAIAGLVAGDGIPLIVLGLAAVFGAGVLGVLSTPRA